MLINILIFFLFCSVAHAENPPTTLYDEGTKQGVVFNFDCVGAGISCTKSGITGTLTVGGGSGSIGIGTANTITYWDSTSTIGSLNTATYPSLTELSYSKGVTSGIQAQIDGKQASGSYATQATTITVDGTANQITSSAGAQDISTNRTWTLSLPSNVGIGTTPAIGTGLSVMTGNVGVGTWSPEAQFTIKGGSGDIIITPTNGNVGINTTTLGANLTVGGTLSVGTGYALQSPLGGGANFQGSVGIGTYLNSSITGLSIMNGNVGIGTWSPRSNLEIKGSIRSDGNVGISTTKPNPTNVQITNGIITTWN